MMADGVFGVSRSILSSANTFALFLYSFVNIRTEFRASLSNFFKNLNSEWDFAKIFQIYYEYL